MKPDSQMTLDRYFRQCVGIDVSKDKFTVCLQMYDRANDVGCHTMSIDFDNTKSGFNQFVKWSFGLPSAQDRADGLRGASQQGPQFL